MSDFNVATTEVSGGGEPGGSSGSGRPSSLWGDARARLLRSPVFLTAGFFILLVTSMAVAPQLWTRKDPLSCDVSLARTPPGWWADLFRGGAEADAPSSVLGFSQLGCDYYAQAVFGARPSLLIAIVATSAVVLIGGVLGLCAGYFGGWTDILLSRLTDIFLALPFLLGALVLLNILPWRNVWTVALALIVLGWTGVARIMRGKVLETKGLDYVAAARSLGATNGRIMIKHVLPNAIAPVVVMATILLGGFVAAEATLTFLGVGLTPPSVSWGVMISQHEPYWDREPWLLLFPCGLLVVTVLSFILAGDALRDALDPKLQ